MKLTREQIVEKLETGDKDFSGADLSESDLVFLCFSGANLTGANFRDNLSFANLLGADLSGSHNIKRD